MQMMFSNNSIQAALEGERKRMLLIAREQAGGQMGRWVHSMLPFRSVVVDAYVFFKTAETTA